jgi:exopolyphosphatase/pppGpp-phosphohydrolase
MNIDVQYHAFSQSDRDSLLNAAYDLAHTCGFDEFHTRQVTRLALLLFNQLQPLHHLCEVDRLWLELAGILHDIGWVEGWRAHHKASLHIILSTQLLPLDSKERLIIGSIARYHRKALPDLSHDHFSALTSEERERVCFLSAFLRFADGLDRSHQGIVKNITCTLDDMNITIHCATSLVPIEEIKGVEEKSDLLRLVFDREIKVVWDSL